MKILKRIISIAMIVALLCTICIMSTVSFGASGTGIGLAQWALKAYNNNWSYVYGGASAGAVDCSGLIYSYAGGYRVGDAQVGNSSYTGSVSSGIPNIHGLGLYQPGHVGVYVGGSMAVDARGDDYGVCYESAYSHNWTTYFKVPGVSYPSNGWEQFNGNYYYYEDGEYLSDTSRTIGGVTYTFSSSGKSSSTPGDTSSKADNSSSSSSTKSSSLRNGSTGDAVIKLQQRLSDLGYYTAAIDGDFGDKTEAAFKLFQTAVGLWPDGIAGDDVNYLYADDAPKYVSESSESEKSEKAEKKETEAAETGAITDNTFEKGDYNEQVVTIQERLIELSYYTGTADGSYGSMTEDAVRVFQGASGITQTGIADSFTLEILFSDDAVENPLKDQPATEPAQSPTIAAVVSPTQAAMGTEVELQTNELSSKALSGVTNDLGTVADTKGNNFEFILWLAIMIVVLLVTFAIVYTVQSKKTVKRGRRYF